MSAVREYGSRFCRGCGRLFEVADPSDRFCASCDQPAAQSPPRTITVLPVAAPAPVAVKQRQGTEERKRAAVTPATRPHVAVKRERASEKGRHRPPRAKNPATGRNSGPVTGQRTLPMLRALAAAPAGLTTPQLAEHASSASSWVNALGSTRQLMLKQERLGRVRQAGTAEGNRTRASVVWRITGDGERYVKEAGASETSSRPAPASEPDYGESARDLLPATAAGRKAHRVLHSAGITTLSDLLYVTSMDLMALPQFGPGCLEAVREALASRGFVLVDEMDENNPGNQHETSGEAGVSEASSYPVPAPAADWPHIYGKPGSPWGTGRRRPAIPFTGQAPACRTGDQVEARDMAGNWLPKVAMDGPRYDHESASRETWLSVPVAIPAEWDRLGEQARFVNWPAEDVRVAAAEPTPDPPKRRQRERPVPRDRSGDPAVPHLTSSGYKNHGCRCEECGFAHQQDVALFRARRKVAAGKALSELEAQVLAEEVADAEERLYYRALPSGGVASAIIPRWVPGGLCGPASPTDCALAAAGLGTGIALAWS